MAQRRTRIPPAIKKQLVNEAGGKCINPGCTAWRTHIHHIKHWSVYKSHDNNHMIAICPTCHDAVHSSGGISDEVLYGWKKILRVEADISGVIYVEPASDIRVLTGSFCVIPTDGKGAVFHLSNNNQFTFQLIKDNIFLASCTIKNLSGAPLVRLVDNRVWVKRGASLDYKSRPGKITVSTMAPNNFLPPWVEKIMWRAMPDLVKSGRSIILDIEVVRPGVVRIEGVFAAPDAVIAITKSEVYILRPELNGPLRIVGQGEDTKIISGPVTRAAFGM